MLIAWSGGLDSSLALKYSLDFWNDRVREWDWGQGKYEKKHGVPRALIIECPQISGPQQKMQAKSRQKLRKFMGYKFDEITAKVEASTPGYTSLGLPQPTMWITQAAMLVDREEPLMLGWLRSDYDAYGALFRIEKIWKELCLLNDKGECPLWLPFRHHTKSEVIKSCHDEKILDLCWWCEDPIKDGRSFKACGKCGPCLNMITARVRIHRSKYPDMDYDEYLEWLLDGDTDVDKDNAYTTDIKQR